jgi:poly(3-hydroxybutyrate) depolymerase
VAPQSAEATKGRRLGTAELLACLGAPSTAIYQPETLAPGTRRAQVFTFDQATANCGIVTRRYVVHIPESVTRPTAAPVVIALPGQGASAESLREFQMQVVFDQLADRDGFVVAYGNGLPTPSNIDGLPNSGKFRSEYTDRANTVDELEYLERITGDLASRGVIRGNNPVYLVGHSGGGGLALSATRQRPERYAGVAAFMAFAGFRPAAPGDLRNTKLGRVMFVMSLTDPGLPANYSKAVLTPLVRGYGRALGIDDSALASPTTTTLPDSVQEGASYQGSSPTIIATRRSTALELDSASVHGKLRLIQFDHAGHFWPTPKYVDPGFVLERYGLRNQDIDGAVEAWRFFTE